MKNKNKEELNKTREYRLKKLLFILKKEDPNKQQHKTQAKIIQKRNLS